MGKIKKFKILQNIFVKRLTNTNTNSKIRIYKSEL